jgi:hypothetical protein
VSRHAAARGTLAGMVKVWVPEGYEPAGSQWIVFSSVLLVMVGIFNVIDGIAAISGADYLSSRVIFADLDTWGVFFIVWGCLQILAGLAVYRGATWGVLFGIAAAFLNAIAHLGWATSYPLWAMCVVAVDVLVIYGLTVHGGTPAKY